MNSHSVWYLGLGVIALCLFLFTWYRERNVLCPLLLLAMIGLGYMIEAVIYIFLDSYRYDPELLRNKPYFDSNLGAIASNSLTLPAAAVFLAAFGGRWLGIALFTLAFGGIEVLFLRLHIYLHHWWRTDYTIGFLPFYFATAIALSKKMMRPLRGWLRSAVLYWIVASVAGTMHILPIMFLHARSYRAGWFGDLERDTTAVSFAYYSCATLVLVLAARAGLRFGWRSTSGIAALAGIATALLTRADVLRSLVWWDIPYFLVLPCLLWLLTVSVDRRLGRSMG